MRGTRKKTKNAHTTHHLICSIHKENLPSKFNLINEWRTHTGVSLLLCCRCCCCCCCFCSSSLVESECVQRTYTLYMTHTVPFAESSNNKKKAVRVEENNYHTETAAVATAVPLVVYDKNRIKRCSVCSR